MEELTLRALVVLIVGCLVVVCTLIIVLIIETLLVGLVVSPALALQQHIVMDDNLWKTSFSRLFIKTFAQVDCSF